MNGPIRTITIDSNTPEPPPNRFDVTITIPMWIDDIPEGVTLEQAAKMLTHDRWNDGRYPFEYEMIHTGLSRVVQGAFREALDEQLQKQHRGMVPDEDGRGCTAAWLIESYKIKGPSVAIYGNIKAAKIEPECSECRGEGYIEKKPAIANWSEHGDREQEVCPKCGGSGVEK